MAEQKYRKALVLSGGGGRGAYQAGVWRYLQEKNWTPDLITGTSVGSLNAAMIGMGWDAERLIGFWQHIERKKVFRSSLGQWFLNALRRVRKSQPYPGGLADPTPLRQLLEDVIDIEALRTQQIEVIITAVQVMTARLRYFDSSQIGVEHLMASCSLPMIFPWQMIEGEPYWDGGLMANTPITPALRSGATELVVILLAPLSGMAQPLPRTRRQALEWALEMATLGSAVTGIEPFLDLHEVNSLDKKGSLDRRGLAEEHAVYQMNNRRLAVVAPRKLLGVGSVLGFDPSKTSELIALGYDDARTQLIDFFP